MLVIESLMAAVIIPLGAVSIGMNLSRPARCPECGGRDTHRYWDAPGTVYTCDDCEGRSFELEEEFGAAWCAFCGESIEHGHADDCPLPAILRRLK